MAGKVIIAASYRAHDERAWAARGYSCSTLGRCNAAHLVETLAGAPAIVAGSGGNLAQIAAEVAQVRASRPQAKVFAVNDAGVYLPKIDYMVSLHEENLSHWAALRFNHSKDDKGHKFKDFETHALIEADHNWEGIAPLMPLSGLFAMQVAWLMGSDEIILIGCPCDSTRRFFDIDQRADFNYGGGVSSSDKHVRAHLIGDMLRLPHFKRAVKSTSGWAKEYFGGVDL